MTLPTPTKTPQISFPIRATSTGPITNDEDDLAQGHIGIKTVDGGSELWYRPISDLVGDPVPDPRRVAENDDLDTLISSVVNKTSFDADNTILKADTTDTPISLTVPASTIVGRGSTGYIDALTASEAKAILVTTLQDVVTANSSATLTTAVPVEILDTDSNALLSVLSTGTGPADNDVILGNAATSDATVQGDTLNLVDDTYSKTLTEIVEGIATNADNISELQMKLYGTTTTSSATTVTDIMAKTLGGTDYPTILDDYKQCWSVVLEAESGSGISQSTAVTKRWTGDIILINGAGSSYVEWSQFTPVYTQNESAWDVSLTISDVVVSVNDVWITVQQTSTTASTRTINWTMTLNNKINRLVSWGS